MRRLLIVILASLSCLIAAGASLRPEKKDPAPAWCRLIALDVGQGDATLIQTSDGQDILIDGGQKDNITDLINRHLLPGDDDLELVVLTHPDSDHLAGLVAALREFSVRSVIVSTATADGKLFLAWQDELRRQNISARVVSGGESLMVGALAKFDVLWPPAAVNEKSKVNGKKIDVNQLSLIVKTSCAGSTALFPGDAPGEIEEQLILSKVDVKAQLLHVAHHGSRFSSSIDFLKAVQPQWALISVGKNNSYHHPHPIVMERLNKLKIRTLRTDEMGEIIWRTTPDDGWSLES